MTVALKVTVICLFTYGYNHRNRMRLAVAQTDRPRLQPSYLCLLRCLAVEMQARRTVLVTLDFDFQPTDVTDAAAKRFGGRFFGCPARRKRFGAPATIGEFAWGVDALKKAFTVPCDGVRNTFDLDQVNTGYKFQGSKPKLQIKGPQ